MNLTFAPRAWDQYLFWQTTDRKMLGRINALIKDTMRTPFDGLGQPEPLHGNLSGLWSRRITREHRMVYDVSDGNLQIVQLRYHY